MVEKAVFESILETQKSFSQEVRALEHLIFCSKKSSCQQQWIENILTQLEENTWNDGKLPLRKSLCSRKAVKIIKQTTDILSQEPNVLDILVPESGKVNVIGDIHGQFHDLRTILDITGFPNSSNILVFNGDFVDRGSWGVEVVLFLCLLKTWQPTSVYLLRGNHETTQCNELYGFKAECLEKFDKMFYKACQDLFSNLPIAAVVSNYHTVDSTLETSSSSSTFGSFSMFSSFSSPRTTSTDSNYRRHGQTCTQNQPRWSQPLAEEERRALIVHGGLFRSYGEGIGTLEEIASVYRKAPNPVGLVSDILWSDPSESSGMQSNSFRNAGVLFGCDITRRFLRRNRLFMMIRSHEGPDVREQRIGLPSMMEGYSVDFYRSCGIEKVDCFPKEWLTTDKTPDSLSCYPDLITLFSAPNYPIGNNSFRNKGAVCQLDYTMIPEIQSFEARPRPIARSSPCQKMTCKTNKLFFWRRQSSS